MSSTQITKTAVSSRMTAIARRLQPAGLSEAAMRGARGRTTARVGSRPDPDASLRPARRERGGDAWRARARARTRRLPPRPGRLRQPGEAEQQEQDERERAEELQ